MFVKVYKYKIKKRNLRKWKNNNDSARKVYKKYGGGNSQRLLSKKGNWINILEIDHYESKNDFIKITKKVEEHPKIKFLLEEFLKIIHNGHFSQEEFETV